MRAAEEAEVFLAVGTSLQVYPVAGTLPAAQAAADADFFLAVGTSLQVYPVAGAVDIAREAGARIVIVNAQPTPFDDVADAVFHESISEILPKILSA